MDCRFYFSWQYILGKMPVLYVKEWKLGALIATCIITDLTTNGSGHVFSSCVCVCMCVFSN